MKIVYLFLSVVLLQCSNKQTESNKPTDHEIKDNPIHVYKDTSSTTENSAEETKPELKKEEAEKAEPEEKKSQQNNSSSVIIREDAKEAARLNYTIDSVFTLGKSLHVAVSYSGGCKEHVFNLLTDNSINNGTLNVYLDHDNNEDACRGIQQKKLNFNLSNLMKTKTPLKINLNGEKELELK